MNSNVSRAGSVFLFLRGLSSVVFFTQVNHITFVLFTVAIVQVLSSCRRGVMWRGEKGAGLICSFLRDIWVKRTAGGRALREIKMKNFTCSNILIPIPAFSYFSQCSTEHISHGEASIMGRSKVRWCTAEKWSHTPRSRPQTITSPSYCCK